MLSSIVIRPVPYVKINSVSTRIFIDPQKSIILVQKAYHKAIAMK